MLTSLLGKCTLCQRSRPLLMFLTQSFSCASSYVHQLSKVAQQTAPDLVLVLQSLSHIAIVVENKTSKKSADINPQNEKRRSPRRQYAILLSFDTSPRRVLFPALQDESPHQYLCVPFSVPSTSPISTSCSIACNVHYPQIMFSTAPPTPAYSRAPVAMPSGTFNLATS